jgi:pimeloyl-ACP methyl ester carboxylesterase
LVTLELIRLNRFTTYRAGHTKHSLPVDNNGAAAFSYTEKGSRNPGKPSIVFVHGLSSNKETWIPIVKVRKY